ncbi:MAG: hypothetical protein GXX91_17960 [Verrucomicrobiaceae bacterium]|nr:hypothetical protein [Verrucomicrobiaceae bacterium]
MKKLLMFAAAMTIVGGAYAQCYEPGGITSECSIPVWDFKASGKTANTVKQGYKSVQSIKFVGALAGIVEMDDQGFCCLTGGFDLFIYEKADKALYIFQGNEIGKMTVFGKNLRKVLKPGKSTSVESDILWTWAGSTEEDGDIELQFVGFGKGKRFLSKAIEDTDPCGDNSVPGCEESFNWPSWNGWFTGWFLDDLNDFETLICEDPCVAVAGGTWSAKFNKKLSGKDDYVSAIEGKFKTRVYEAY